MDRVDYNKWEINESSFDFNYLQYYETIFTLGNGYLGTRGSLEEGYKEDKPGTFIAGTFDEAPGEVTELPNGTDWTAVELELGGERFDLKTGEILDYNRKLNLKRGILTREVKWKSPIGKITTLCFERFVSIADQHKMGIKITVTPENYSGDLKLVSRLNGQITNNGTQHFIEEEKQAINNEQGIYFVQRTQQSNIRVALAAFHNLYFKGQRKFNEQYEVKRRQISYTIKGVMKEKEEYMVEKLVSIYTDREVMHPKKKAIKSAREAKEISYKSLKQAHIQNWERKWEECDIKIEGPTFDQLALRFAIFHQLQMANKRDDTVSIPAKGLTGEGYKGHIFWDNEIFNLPFFIYNYPEAAKNLLKYRYNTLKGARENAQKNGYEGAQFPWESARTGEETTPKWGGLDVVTGEPIRILCGEIEHHITADIAYAIFHYYWVTGDKEFLYNYGMEILLETARFWASRVEYDKQKDRYEINDVIGPDEYSEHVDNDLYTNMLVKWQLENTVQLSKKLQVEAEEVWKRLVKKIDLELKELKQWQEIAEKIFINYDPEKKLYIQYEGFLEDENIDDKIKEAKRRKVPLLDILSWEEIARKSQVLKQPDVIMIQYLLSNQFSREEKETAWRLYEPRTMHDSSLSPAIHSIIAVEIGNLDKAYEYFRQSSKIDLIPGSSSAGLHAASLGGLWQAAVNGFAGMRWAENNLEFNPYLPREWNKLEFSVIWRGERLFISLTNEYLTIKADSNLMSEIKFKVYNKEYKLLSPEEKVINLSKLKED